MITSRTVLETAAETGFRSEVVEKVLRLRGILNRLDGHPTARDDCPYDQIFVGQGDTLDDVQVRFSPRVARWLKERYPSATTHDDGAVTVTYQVASPDWLVERVLQYGEDAEVVGPALYRAAVRRAVS